MNNIFTPIKNHDGSIKSFFIKETNKSLWYCSCGCNCFQKDMNDDTWYKCNACGTNYTA